MNSPSSIYSPPLFLKAFLGIISLCFFGGVVYFLLKTQWLRRIFLTDFFEFLSFKPYEMRAIGKKWAKITKRLKKAKEAELKLAVIEADDLLNEVLEKMGHAGETLSEKLKLLDKSILSNLEEILQVHQIRSHIAHDPTYELTLDSAKKILEVYKKALLELQAL
jgi:hypothetical protein